MGNQKLRIAFISSKRNIMKIFEVQDKELGTIFLADCFPQTLKSDKLEYFVYGHGYKKTKKFKVLEGDMPETYQELSWLDIAVIHEKFGIEVANEYAKRKVAGIISRQTANGYASIYQKIKHLIADGFDHSFFELLKCDYFMACFGMYQLDIIALDEKLSKIDPTYDCQNATYGDIKDCSMKQYIEIKYGKLCADVVDAALS